MFELERVSSSSCFFDNQKLKWMNARYLREYDKEALTYLCIPHFQKAGLLGENISKETLTWLKTMIAHLRESASTLEDVVEACRPFFNETVVYSEQVLLQFQDEHMKKVLSESINAVEKLNEFTQETLNRAFGHVAYKMDMPVRDVFKPVRLALTGQTRGPEMYKILQIYGKEKALRILRRAAGKDVIES